MFSKYLVFDRSCARSMNTTPGSAVVQAAMQIWSQMSRARTVRTAGVGARDGVVEVHPGHGAGAGAVDGLDVGALGPQAREVDDRRLAVAERHGSFRRTAHDGVAAVVDREHGGVGPQEDGAPA